MVVSCHVGAENETGDPWKDRETSLLLLPVPSLKWVLEMALKPRAEDLLSCRLLFKKCGLNISIRARYRCGAEEQSRD